MTNILAFRQTVAFQSSQVARAENEAEKSIAVLRECLEELTRELECLRCELEQNACTKRDGFFVSGGATLNPPNSIFSESGN